MIFLGCGGAGYLEGIFKGGGGGNDNMALRTKSRFENYEKNKKFQPHHPIPPPPSPFPPLPFALFPPTPRV